MKYPSKVDVPVLITFFARPDTLQKVFDSVKEARPSTLLLWQDGPRKGRQDDVENIKKCRDIVENIDWECTVFKNYHDDNMGCDPSTFRAQKWAFSNVDKCIVLEDDMVPSQSFYPYCKELLEKYEFDERINHICGVNPLGIVEHCPDDYFFVYSGTGAWASWRRVAEQWDENYRFLDKDYYLYNTSKRLPVLFKVMKEHAIKRRATGFEWWESIIGFNCVLNNRLVIIPKVNLVSNVGVVGGTHSSSVRLLNKKVRKLFDSQAYELKFPLKHPEYFTPDFKYMNELSKINCLGHPWIARWRKLEYLAKCIIYGEIFKKLKRK